MAKGNTKSEKNFITPVGRLLQDFVSAPSTKHTKTPRWSCKVAFPKSEKAKLKEIAKEAEALYQSVYKGAEKTPEFMPLIKDGDVYHSKRTRQGKQVFDEFKDTYYLSVSTSFAPKYSGPTRKTVDPSVFYCGCMVALQITPFIFIKGDNEGCSAYLDMIQFVRHNERLYTSSGGNLEAFEEFEDVELESKNEPVLAFEDDDIPF